MGCRLVVEATLAGARAMGERPEDDFKSGGSMFTSVTFIAAVIGLASAVLSAVLPWWLSTRSPESIPSHQAHQAAASAVAPITPIAATTRALPNLTFGVWTIVASTDEAGSDFRGSTIKFKSQRETPEGLELVGWFEWRNNNETVIGEEHFVAHFEAATRQLYIEGQYVNSPTGQLAVGSFSARLSDDGRQLVDGRWGNTPSHQSGIPGSWEARR
jgi:hypothetical protein